MRFTGVIVEESLADRAVLDDVLIIRTEVEPVTEEHRTPWIRQWTMHEVQISPDRVAEIVEKISSSLDCEHFWYADFRNNREHFVIYSHKVFHITDRADRGQYDEAVRHGILLGIPPSQLDFSPYASRQEGPVCLSE